MTDLEILKKTTGETDEELLTMLLTEATDKMLAETNRTKVVSGMTPAIREWAIVAYNRMGIQGESSRSEGGISSSMIEVPKLVQDTISRYRIARVGGLAHETAETTA